MRRYTRAHYFLNILFFMFSPPSHRRCGRHWQWPWTWLTWAWNFFLCSCLNFLNKRWTMSYHHLQKLISSSPGLSLKPSLTGPRRLTWFRRRSSLKTPGRKARDRLNLCRITNAVCARLCTNCFTSIFKTCNIDLMQIWRLLISINWISSTKAMNPITRKIMYKITNAAKFQRHAKW